MEITSVRHSGKSQVIVDCGLKERKGKVSYSCKNASKYSAKNEQIHLLSLLTRDEEIGDEELRLATAANCFVQEVGRASQFRKRIEDGKKIRCSISIQSYYIQGNHPDVLAIPNITRITY